MGAVRYAVQNGYEDYLRDESRSAGEAEWIVFPENEEELIEAIRSAARDNIPMTVQGARTGISAGAVPHGGMMINLSRMNRVLGIRYCPTDISYRLVVQPGLVLSDLKEMVEKKSFDTFGWCESDIKTLERFTHEGSWFFPPDPTETSASIGGMIACNASGARSFHYGPTRNYVAAVNAITAQGEKLTLCRGENRAKEYKFEIEAESGKIFTGEVPSYPWPKVKNASGFYPGSDIDLIDLFIGSEGTLGVVSSAEIRLIPRPGSMWSMTAFFPDEASALGYVQLLRKSDFQGAYTAAIEYFNNHALTLLREQRANPAFSEIPTMPAEYHTAIYIEIHGENDDVVSDAMMQACEILIETGGDDEHTWMATNPREMEKLHFFRHATPEAVNLKIDERRRKTPGLTKLGTDMAVPNDHLIPVMEMYNQTLNESGLEWVMFGHIGDNHVHVNILPNTTAEYEQGKQMYRDWARQIIARGGTVSAEHGIGKLKAGMLHDMYGDSGIEMMKDVKRVFDPLWLLNRGSVFETA